jgi:glycerol uptake facilitator-like aquaporin
MSDNNKIESAVNGSPYANKSISRKLGEAGFECFATFLFMCTIFFTKGQVEYFGFGFWVILSVFGPISGGHVNPAVTIAFYFIEQDWVYGLMKMGLYIVAQFIGCFAGVGLAYGIVGEQIFQVGTGSELFKQAFFAEFFFTGTFFFIIAVCTHAKYPPTKFGPFNCAIIIAWFFMCCKAGGHLSGAAYNPAVLLALNLTTSAFGKNKEMATKNVPPMVAGEIVGAVVFAMVFKYVYCPFYEMIMDEKNNASESNGFLEVKTKSIEA